MPGLAEIQRRFAASIRDRNNAAADLLAGDGVAPHLRLAIHRNNSYASLVEVLAGVFPRIARLFGDGLFRAAAIAYIAEQPPARAQLALYGDGLPAFLGRFEAASGYPWLADLAGLEWARHEAFFARDRPGLTVADLSAVAPDQYGELRLKLHPAVRLIHSVYPLDALWDAAVRPERATLRETYIVVVRPDMSVLHFSSTAADFAFLRAVSAGETLDAAAGLAFEIDPLHDLSAALAQHLRFGVFSVDTLAAA